jgi:hypothetical protein
MRLLWQAALVTMLTVPGWSDVLYSNGPINGSVNAYVISGANEVSDSFVISANSTVTGVSNIGLWVQGSGIPNTPLALDWVISTAPNGGGTVEDSGSGASLTSSAFVLNAPYEVYSASFSVGSLGLAAGTYYLELTEATSTPDQTDYPYVFWDQNEGTGGDGPSSAYIGGSSIASVNSESFEIDGTAGVAAVPAPSSVILLSTSLLA